MEKMETEHGVLFNSNDEGKDRRRKIQSVPVLFLYTFTVRQLFKTTAYQRRT